MKCQLVQNFYAAQIEPDGMNATERKRIEDQAKRVKPKSNYFQAIEKESLSAPRDAKITNDVLTWNTALADEEPISHYEVFRDGELLAKVEHKPQLLKSQPFSYTLDKPGNVVLATVDKAGNRAETVVA